MSFRNEILRVSTNIKDPRSDVDAYYDTPEKIPGKVTENFV